MGDPFVQTGRGAEPTPGEKEKQVYTMGLYAYFLEFYNHDQKISLEIEGITPDMARLLTEEGDYS